jgi:hypothetical protein
MRDATFLPSRSAWLLLLLAVLTLPVQAQWLWRDKDGRVTASDRPPPRDVPDKDILSRPAAEARRAATATPPASAAASAAPAPKGPLEREVEARKRAADAEQAAKAKADEERAVGVRAENCRRARGQVAALETGQRMSRMNDKGEREILDDRARADEMRQAREVIASDCR